jgi:hypothetical protein
LQQLHFPEPVVIANRNYYPRGSVRRYLAELAGEQFVPQPDDENLMTTRAVRQMFGGVSAMWVWRKRQHKPAASGEAA